MTARMRSRGLSLIYAPSRRSLTEVVIEAPPLFRVVQGTSKKGCSARPFVRSVDSVAG
jgi:hypothetical protein